MSVSCQAPSLAEKRSLISPFSSALRSRQFAGMFDQGLASGNNFLTVVLIGKLSGAATLGTYALAFSALMVLQVLADALVCWPYTLRLHEEQKSEKRFAGSVVVHLAVFVLLVSVAAAAISPFLPGVLEDGSNFTRLALAFALLAPAGLFRQFARRFEFAREKVYVAIVVDACVLAGQLGGLLWLGLTEQLTSVNALLTIAAVNGTVALFWLVGKFRKLEWQGTILSDWKNNFVLGRWLVGSELIGIFSADFMYWLLAATQGVEATGVFAACFTVIMLLNPLLLGFQNVFQPRCAALLAEFGKSELRREVGRALRTVAAGMTLFFLLAATLGGWLVAAVYGEAEYGGRHWVVILLAAQGFMAAIAIPVVCGLNALRKTNLDFWAGLVRTITSVILALPLLMGFGLAGAAAALLIGTAAGTALRIAAFYRVCPAEGQNTETALSLDAEAA